MPTRKNPAGITDRAIIDALGRISRASVTALVRANIIGLTAATAPDLVDFRLDAFLASLQPAPSIAVRSASPTPRCRMA